MTDRDRVREACKADPVSPLSVLAERIGMDRNRFAIVAWQVAHYDRTDYHATRQDARRIKRSAA